MFLGDSPHFTLERRLWRWSWNLRAGRHKAGLRFPTWFPCCFENHAANYSVLELFSTAPLTGRNGLSIVQKSAFCPVNVSQGKFSKETDTEEFECDSFFSLEIPKGLGMSCCLQSLLTFSLRWAILCVFISFLWVEGERKGSISLWYEDGLVTQHKREIRSKGRPAHEHMAPMALWSSRGRDCLTFSLLHF